MSDTIKITLIAIVVAMSFIFTLLTVETIDVNGEVIRYCRPIEVWCQNSNADLIIYDVENDQYFTGYQFGFTDITIKEGMFYDEDTDAKYTTNVSDGTYDSINGIVSWTDYPKFTVPNETNKYIGGVE